ncbi:uncharacterized protein LOC116095085 isoform X2 [Mastomys coucha]|uniref:uncharacterized protein LOC116095085 isoform X2 n=1 Tax=Mastomys coucha TaxID=35658 RepID=UPI0012621F09|nr:uncharacterized protein LOC116095085 isoform X2 [Mastomys coucha]
MALVTDTVENHILSGRSWQHVFGSVERHDGMVVHSLNHNTPELEGRQISMGSHVIQVGFELPKDDLRLPIFCICFSSFGTPAFVTTPALYSTRGDHHSPAR